MTCNEPFLGENPAASEIAAFASGIFDSGIFNYSRFDIKGEAATLVYFSLEIKRHFCEVLGI